MMEWTGILAITGHASILFNLYKLASMPVKRLGFLVGVKLQQVLWRR
jgi:hypothetical protein